MNVVAEIIGGVRHPTPRPARRHTIAATNLGEELGTPFNTLLAVHHGEARVRAEPFDAIELELAILWAR